MDLLSHNNAGRFAASFIKRFFFFFLTNFWFSLRVCRNNSSVCEREDRRACSSDGDSAVSLCTFHRGDKACRDHNLKLSTCYSSVWYCEWSIREPAVWAVTAGMRNIHSINNIYLSNIWNSQGKKHLNFGKCVIVCLIFYFLADFWEEDLSGPPKEADGQSSHDTASM